MKQIVRSFLLSALRSQARGGDRRGQGGEHRDPRLLNGQSESQNARYVGSIPGLGVTVPIVTVLRTYIYIYIFCFIAYN